MPRPRKRRKIRGKVKLSQNAYLVQKNDNTRVKRDTLPQAPTRLAPDVGANFRIKIRKKNGN